MEIGGKKLLVKVDPKTKTLLDEYKGNIFGLFISLFHYSLVLCTTSQYIQSGFQLMGLLVFRVAHLIRVFLFNLNYIGITYPK